MGRVHDKIALVTGAASGIGKATAQLLAHEGARLVLTDINTEQGSALADALGENTLFLEQNTIDEARWQEVIAETVETFGGLHILVNGAGIPGTDQPQDIENASLELWRKVLAVNLDGVFLGCKHAIPAMRKTGNGSIINLASVAGHIGVPLACAYGASKGAVRQLTKTVALHCAGVGDNIRCNSLSPGLIDTPIWDSVLGEGDKRLKNLQEYAALTPMNAFGTPQDVAAAVLYLASDESNYVTGTDIIIDGGQVAR